MTTHRHVHSAEAQPSRPPSRAILAATPALGTTARSRSSRPLSNQCHDPFRGLLRPSQHFEIPEAKHSPALPGQLRIHQPITRHVSGYLLVPERAATTRRELARMAMPEGPIDEDDDACRPKYDVGRARKRATVTSPAPEPKSKKTAPQQKFRSRIRASHPGHHATADLWRKAVSTHAM